MHGTYDPFLVLLSLAIAIFASFTALSLAGRIRESSGRARTIWLATSALALGAGVWTMHFVAMLAFSMPGMAIGYDPPLTLVSLALPILFAGIGLVILNRRAVSNGRIAVAGLLVATGVVGMHYLGMAAMRMPGELRYDPFWVAVSIVVAVAASTAAVWLTSRDQTRGHRLAAAGAMGIAIAGMHYAGMQAARFGMAGIPIGVADGTAVAQAYLALAISVATSVLLILALGAAQLERVLRRAALREARIALRLKVADVFRGRDAEAALAEVAALLGAHFKVSRAGIGDLDAAAENFDYRICWTDGSVPALRGRHSASAFGDAIVEALLKGETIAIDDLDASPLGREPLARETASALDTRAILVVPFARAGGCHTIVYLNDTDPRVWEDEAIAFLEEIAERIRLVIERLAVEDQLRELNATLEVRVEERTRELREAEAARRDSDALYRAYFENLPDPLFVISADPTGAFAIEAVNPAYERGFGIDADAVRGQHPEAFLPPDVAEEAGDRYRALLASGEVQRYRETRLLKGDVHQWDTTLVPLRDAGGRVARIVGASRDMTAQMTAEAALRQSQKMEAMGQLTGGVAHDFNNLLTPIMGALDRLDRGTIGDERDRRLVSGALQCAERARTLVQRLLSFARRQPLQPVPVDLGERVRGIGELVARTIGPQIEMSVEIAPDLPPALVDPNQLEMAILNLSVNARDAMPQGGRLRIAVETSTAAPANLPPGRYLCLSVADTGTGMDEATMARAIEPFFSTKGIGQGTGLGLSMAHGLAAQLGGALTLDSAPGRGTTVRLWLPEGQSLPTIVPEVPILIERRSGETVLLVDDDEAVRNLTAQILADLDFTVVKATSAAEALAMIDEGLAPGLLVTDHLMPGLTGTELAHLIKVRLPTTRVLIVSGYAEETGIDPSIARLNKPFVRNDLAAAIAALG